MTLSIDKLLVLLKKRHIAAEVQQETGQIVFGFEEGGSSYPVFIRIFPESQLLQLLVFLPLKLQEGKEGEVGRLLHWINQSLDLPGFGMEEHSKSLFFRCMLPALGMSFDEGLLDPFLGAIRTVATTFLPPIQKVNSGTLSFNAAKSEISSS